MGIIDDYYGGYENLALFTNSDGEVDFEGAYYNQLDDEEWDGHMSMPPLGRSGRGGGRGSRGGREVRAALPGWTMTGRTTREGKHIYEGSCSSCHQHCTVPFKPLAGGNPPMCRTCLGRPQGPAHTGQPAAAAGGSGSGMPPAGRGSASGRPSGSQPESFVSCAGGLRCVAHHFSKCPICQVDHTEHNRRQSLYCEEEDVPCRRCGAVPIAHVANLCWMCCPCVNCGSEEGNVNDCGICAECYHPMCGERLV